MNSSTERYCNTQNTSALSLPLVVTPKKSYTGWIVGGGLASTALGTGTYLKYYDDRHLVETAVRFSRSMITAGQVAFDYKWSLRGVTDPEERAKVMSEVRPRLYY